MYNVPLPAAAIRTRIRQEFERNRQVNQLSVVDVLLFKSHAEYQVCGAAARPYAAAVFLGAETAD